MADTKAQTIVKVPVRASGGGNPSPPRNRYARAGLYILVIGSALAGLAFAFELGRFLGHREGIAYANERKWMVDYAGYVLEEARRGFAICNDIAGHIALDRKNPWLQPRRPRVAQSAAGETCQNCGPGQLERDAGRQQSVVDLGRRP